MRKMTVALASTLAMVACEKTDTVESAQGVRSANEDAEASAELRVEVFYRERMLLPPTAMVQVVLEDSARMDVAAHRIAETTVPAREGPPYRVSLRYDPSSLSPKGRFGVRARIENDGSLMFTSTRFIPAFGTDGEPDSAPNDPVQVLVQRTAGTANTTATSITGTRWVLKTLRGEAAGLGAGGRAAYILLQGAEPRVSGFTGCNQISGGYSLEGKMLSFGQLAMTMRACMEGEDLERAFANALDETRRYAMEGRVLELIGEDGEVVARLQAE